MVKEIKNNSKKTYQCEECKLFYNDFIWAEKCEEWCKKYHTCNVEITKHSDNVKSSMKKK